MIREMRVSDWNEMMDIYKQSLERGDVTFRTECPTYEEWDREHIKECRFVYELDGRVIGYTMIAPTSSIDKYGVCWGFLYRLVKRNALYYSNIAAAMEMS